MSESSGDRMRTPPQERFAHEAVQFDLSAAADELAKERHEGQHGHRQIALYKHGQATVALFRFERGGRMAEHQARGTVFLQVMEGHLSMKVGDATHKLRKGEMLVLAPGVAHDVFAEEASVMLLTVCMNPEEKR